MQALLFLQEKDNEAVTKLGGVEGLCTALASSSTAGLSPDSVPSLAARQTVFGENRFKEVPMKGFLKLLFENLKDPTLLLLMAAALVGWCLLDYEWLTPCRQHQGGSTHAMFLPSASLSACSLLSTVACATLRIWTRYNCCCSAQVSTVLGFAIRSQREEAAWTEGIAIWVAVGVVSLVGASHGSTSCQASHPCHGDGILVRAQVAVLSGQKAFCRATVLADLCATQAIRLADASRVKLPRSEHL